MLEEYAEFCYDQVGGYALGLVDIFEDLRPKINKAGLGVSLPEYLSLMVVTTGLVLLVSLLFFGIIFSLSSGISGFILSLVISIVLGTLTFLVLYIYPSLIVSSRATKIRDTLPFATMYLSTLAGTGTALPEIFENLANVEEYGEVTKEAEKISRDLNTLGMDISEALERAAQRTPSEDFEELMWGMNHVITTGGSLREFLKQRADKLMNEYQRRVERFADQLSLLVEMYITVVIVGSIIFTSMSAVMSSFGSFEPEMIVIIQTGAVFIGLPFISGVFILFVRGISPGGIR